MIKIKKITVLRHFEVNTGFTTKNKRKNIKKTAK